MHFAISISHFGAKLDKLVIQPLVIAFFMVMDL